MFVHKTIRRRGRVCCILVPPSGVSIAMLTNFRILLDRRSCIVHFASVLYNCCYKSVCLDFVNLTHVRLIPNVVNNHNKLGVFTLYFLFFVDLMHAHNFTTTTAIRSCCLGSCTFLLVQGPSITKKIPSVSYGQRVKLLHHASRPCSAHSTRLGSAQAYFRFCSGGLSC